MSTQPGETPNPHNDPVLDQDADLPAEEDIDAAQVDEQLETEPDEARNRTDGYAPEDEED
jgi:hypothetical protein